jgi:hypothetical protein
VRVFDAHAASFEARLELLRGFGQLVESWRAPLDARSRRWQRSARACTRASRARWRRRWPRC